jgi:hypothetical protein
MASGLTLIAMMAFHRDRTALWSSFSDHHLA